METLAVWGHKFRPWGYEVRVDLQDDSGRIYNEVLSFPVKNKEDVPDKEAITKASEDLAVRIQTQQIRMAEELAQEPMRKAQEAKAEFMSAVSAGLIKADEMVAKLQPFITGEI